jgi:hypothetical protein
MSTRHTVTGTTSTRIVERSRMTVADGHHQHRRRTGGLVSDSRFKRPHLEVLSSKLKKPHSTSQIRRRRSDAGPAPRNKVRRGGRTRFEASGLIPIPTRNTGRRLSRSWLSYSRARGIAPGEIALHACPSAVSECPLS